MLRSVLLVAAVGLHCTLECLQDDSEGPCLRQLTIDFNTCQGNMTLHRTTERIDSGQSVSISESDLVIRCSSPKCLSIIKSFPKEADESVSKPEQKALNCLEELVKDGRLYEALRKAFQKKLPAKAGHSVTASLPHPDRSSELRKRLKRNQQKGGRGRTKKGKTTTTRPAPSPSARDEVLTISSKDMYNIIFISLSVALGLILLGQLFLAIYLNRVQNQYILMELSALDAVHVELESEDEDDEEEAGQKSEMRSESSTVKASKTETVPEELLSQKSLVMLKSEQIRQLPFKLPGM